MASRDSEYFLRKSQKELKRAYLSAETCDRRKLFAQCTGALSNALYSIIVLMQENQPGAGADPDPPGNLKIKNTGGAAGSVGGQVENGNHKNK
jgi:hypothetical protein